MVNKKILGLIGLTAKAGKISFGADSVEIDIKKKLIKIVIIAEDASNRTKEKFKKICEDYNIPIIQFGNIETLSKAIGKNNKAIIGIKDINLAREIKKLSDGGEFIG